MNLRWFSISLEFLNSGPLCTVLKIKLSIYLKPKGVLLWFCMYDDKIINCELSIIFIFNNTLIHSLFFYLDIGLNCSLLFSLTGWWISILLPFRNLIYPCGCLNSAQSSNFSQILHKKTILHWFSFFHLIYKSIVVHTINKRKYF